MAEVTWVLKAYDIHGNPITALSYDTSLSASNIIRHASERKWTINLNSYDQLDFMLYLDDPMAALINRGEVVVKLFRSINDTENSKVLDGSATPCFCGVVSYTMKSGEENTMRISCMSPLWRLQTHFHIDNHYLETNIDTGDIYTQSELIWKLIDLVNNAFGGDSFTGIDRGTFHWGLPDEPQIGPYFVGRGTNTWTNIFDNIMNRPEAADIVPVYYHSNGSRRQMYLDTYQKRGSDKAASVSFSFNYHTDPDILTPNLDDLTVEEQIIPGEFGNYMWVVGASRFANGPNSGNIAARENSSAVDGSDGFGELGVYMIRVDRSEVLRFDAIGPIADAEFARRKHPVPAYTIVVSPVAGTYYDYDYQLGDVVYLNADRGALSITNAKQRIYQATISMSENNVETAELLVSKDFLGKVEEA